MVRRELDAHAHSHWCNGLSPQANTPWHHGNAVTPHTNRAQSFRRRSTTDHQQYSIENQHEAIQRFADARGIKIVRSFVDAGKSGVSIHGRDALQDLLRIVESGQAGFSSILV
jgi:hypothetical protein